MIVHKSTRCKLISDESHDFLIIFVLLGGKPKYVLIINFCQAIVISVRKDLFTKELIT